MTKKKCFYKGRTMPSGILGFSWFLSLLEICHVTGRPGKPTPLITG